MVMGQFYPIQKWLFEGENPTEMVDAFIEFSRNISLVISEFAIERKAHLDPFGGFQLVMGIPP